MPLQNKGMATVNSRIKMRVYTTRENENKCWFSPAKENKKPNAEIIKGMKDRFFKNLSSGKTVVNAKINCLIWYDAFTGAELDKFKP